MKEGYSYRGAYWIWNFCDELIDKHFHRAHEESLRQLPNEHQAPILCYKGEERDNKTYQTSNDCNDEEGFEFESCECKGEPAGHGSRKEHYRLVNYVDAFVRLVISEPLEVVAGAVNVHEQCYTHSKELSEHFVLNEQFTLLSDIQTLGGVKLSLSLVYELALGRTNDRSISEELGYKHHVEHTFDSCAVRDDTFIDNYLVRFNQ